MFELYIDLCFLLGGIYVLLWTAGYFPLKPKDPEAIMLKRKKNLYLMYVSGTVSTIYGLFLLFHTCLKWMQQ